MKPQINKQIFFFLLKNKEQAKSALKIELTLLFDFKKKCAFINNVRNDDVLMTTYQKQKNHFKD